MKLLRSDLKKMMFGAPIGNQNAAKGGSEGSSENEQSGSTDNGHWGSNNTEVHTGTTGFHRGGDPMEHLGIGYEHSQLNINADQIKDGDIKDYMEKDMGYSPETFGTRFKNDLGDRWGKSDLNSLDEKDRGMYFTKYKLGTPIQKGLDKGSKIPKIHYSYYPDKDNSQIESRRFISFKRLKEIDESKSEDLPRMPKPIKIKPPKQMSLFRSELKQLMKSDTTVSQPAAFEYQTKETAPNNIQDRFGICETQDPQVISGVPKKFLKNVGECKVFVVDGEYVRDKIDSDFDQGGNWMAYPEFVPVHEIWIDSKDTVDEVPFVIKHEYDEAEMMKNGKIYSNDKDGAHDIAKAAEDEARKGMIEKNTQPIGMNLDPAVPGEMKKFSRMELRKMLINTPSKMFNFGAPIGNQNAAKDNPGGEEEKSGSTDNGHWGSNSTEVHTREGGFVRGVDPKEAMGIGKKPIIAKILSGNGYEDADIESLKGLNPELDKKINVLEKLQEKAAKIAEKDKAFKQKVGDVEYSWVQQKYSGGYIPVIMTPLRKEHLKEYRSFYTPGIKVWSDMRDSHQSIRDFLKTNY
jgi:hypothetical protein